ncbi:hypothetical protein ABZV29_00015 [Streptomyces sp. NPDC005236]|uniref:hypothetical protein n=1 Tax=Streptomyces sp. NPDC005236 TaxID=3157028 RepID=UPI0033B2460F
MGRGRLLRLCFLLAVGGVGAEPAPVEKAPAGGYEVPENFLELAAEGNTDAAKADVYTDYSGGMFGPHANDGKLIASAFADWQKSRGKSSENGLVTVYDKGAETLSNGKF